MKIAILTQPLGHNYGGLLQAFALQRYLSGRGHLVETLNRRAPFQAGKAARHLAVSTAKLMMGRSLSIPTPSMYARMYRELADFLDRYIVLSRRITSERQLRAYTAEQDFDAYVVGSDQVWRPRYSPSLSNYFLDFLDDIGSRAKRISYAASFGVDYWELTPAETAQCKDLLARFDAVSVRESSGVRLCERHLGRTPEWLVDPALLIERQTYESIAMDAGTETSEGTVLTYILDHQPPVNRVVERVIEGLGGRTFSVLPPKSVLEVRRKDIDQCVYPPVALWLRKFLDAEFVVTDSFHGTLFSIIFKKPFLAIGNRIRGLTRFSSILGQLGLEDRLVGEPEEITSQLLHREIDWRAVDYELMLQRAAAERFLAVHLEAPVAS